MLLERCCSIKCRNGLVVNLTPDLKDELKSVISSMSRRPLRCLLLAVKELNEPNPSLLLSKSFHNSSDFAQIESNLTVVGLVGTVLKIQSDWTFLEV